MLSKQNLRVMVSLSCLLNLATIQTYAQSAWPYHHLPSTHFSRVIGPSAADSNFIFNGRPVGFKGKPENLPDLERKIEKALRASEAAADNNGVPQVVASESFDYMEKIEATLEELGNKRLKIGFNGDKVEVTYTPPVRSLGNNDIHLYDAQASIFARQHRYDEASGSMRKSLQRKLQTFGPQSDEVGQQLVDLGGLSEDSGNYADAEKYYRQGYEVVRKIHGDQSKESAAVLMQLSHALASGHRGAEADREGQKAIAIMDALGIKHNGFGLPPLPVFHWSGVSYDVDKIISLVNQDTARQTADVEAMRQTLYNMIHEEEIRRRREEEARRAAAEAARRQKIREHNMELLKDRPDLAGVTFKNQLSQLVGYIKFAGSGDADISPDYEKLDAKTVPRVAGKYTLSDESRRKDSDEHLWVIRITSQYDGTDRADEWILSPSDSVEGEIQMNALHVEKPYPVALKGKLEQ